MTRQNRLPAAKTGSSLFIPRHKLFALGSLVRLLLIASFLVSCAPEPERTISEEDEAAREAAYESELSVGGYVAALKNAPVGDGDGDIDIDLPEPTTPSVSLTSRSTNALHLRIRTGVGSNELYRSVGSGTRSRLAALASTTKSYGDTAVTPGTAYCYEIKSTSAGTVTWSNRICTRTLYEQYRFTGLGINKAESDAMLQTFDWHRTEALYAGGAEPHLWYMNVLIDAPDSLRALRAAGVHAQTMPFFEAERNALATNATLPTENGVAAGMWVYAVVPAPLYNDMRLQMIQRADRGEEQLFRAAVFRSVPVTAARVWVASEVSPLSYQHLVEQGLEYNGETAQTCFETSDGRVCSIRQEIFGWIARKIFHFVADLIEDVVDGVRGAFGKYKRLVKGEATLTLDFAVHNTDTTFGMDMESGWGQTAIELKNLRIKVYQGFAGFYGTTGSNGKVAIKVAKGRSGKVCIELQNQYVEFLDIFTEREVCVGTVPSINADTTRTVDVTNDYVNAFVQMTDTAEYMKELTGQRMSRVVVMTGGMANTFTNDARSFAPCLGRWPNLTINVVAQALPVLGTVAVEIAEFLMSVDIVLDTSSMKSRGVGTHEYSHTVMCEIMHDTNYAAADIAWADLIAHISSQTVANQQTYIVEGFADFLTSQVVGGMNYVPLDGATDSLDVVYSVPGSASAETNLKDCPSCSDKNAFKAQVARVATLLHDAFDGPSEGPGFANDASHWKLASSKLVLDHIRDHRDDDDVELKGAQLFELFEAWSDRGVTLRDTSFLGGLGSLMVRAGHGKATVCDLFRAHASDGSCPSYIENQFPSTPIIIARPIDATLN